MGRNLEVSLLVTPGTKQEFHRGERWFFSIFFYKDSTHSNPYVSKEKLALRKTQDIHYIVFVREINYTRWPITFHAPALPKKTSIRTQIYRFNKPQNSIILLFWGNLTPLLKYLVSLGEKCDSNL